MSTENKSGSTPEGICPLNIALYVSGSIKFYGGGEKILLLISSGLEKRGYSNKIHGNSLFSGIIRDPSGNDLNGIKYSEIPYKNETFPLNIFYQPFPPSDYIKKYDVNILMMWRIPSRGQLKKCIRSGKTFIFLFHGIGLEKLRREKRANGKEYYKA